MTEDTLYDVAIVGFGPSGVVAAALLGQAGFKVYVCDRLPGVYEIPRAMAIDHEIMRVFQQIGVAEEVLPYTEPFTDSEYIGVDGQVIRRMTMMDPPYPQGYTPSIVFTQPDVERVLRRRVARLPGVTVALETTLRQLTQDAHEVQLALDSNDGQTTTRVRARYAIACDGGTSTVRQQLGIAFEDLGFDEPWLVVDVLANDQGLAKLPRVSVQYCEPARPCTLVLGPKNHRRFEISIRADEDPQQLTQSDATWKLLARWITPDDGELWRQVTYRFHALVAAEWRRGRVFLAGDAAHMQPPFLGQGMCQGVRDVYNLSWKLAAVLRGEVAGPAGEALLDSYGTERKAHVRELTSRIKRIGAEICERDPQKARQRDAALLAQHGGRLKDTPRQDILPRLETGFLSACDVPGRGELVPQPRIHRAGERTLLDQVTGNGWRLVVTPRHASAALGATAVLADLCVVSLDEMSEVQGVAASWFARRDGVAALVRPDNYVYGIARSASGVLPLLEEAAAALGHAAVTA